MGAQSVIADIPTTSSTRIKHSRNFLKGTRSFSISMVVDMDAEKPICPKCNEEKVVLKGLCEECRKQLKPTEAGMLEYLKEEDRKKLFGK
jgi:predicted amidophosphoribosyltransferase